MQVNAGVQGQFLFNQDWGVLIPNLEFSLSRELTSDQDEVNGQFVFAPAGTGGFSLSPEEVDSLFYRVGLGANIVLPNGFSGFVGLQKLLAYEELSSNQLQAGFRAEF